MPYISELLNNKVKESSDTIVGRLKDILIKPQDGTFAPLEYLAVETLPQKQIQYIPYEAIGNFTDKEITLKNLFRSVALEQLPSSQYINLKREVLDQQIVDIAGTRVVRVNDLRIGNVNGRMCVLGIDSSFRGLLRRLGLGESLLARPFTVQLIDWRNAQLLEGNKPLQLNTAAEHLSHLHPADLANIVEDMDIKRGSSLLASLDEKEAAKVLEEIDPKLQNILVKYLGPSSASKILAQMSSDEITDLVKTFSGEEAKIFLSQVNGGRAKSIEKLINYPDNTAGGLMTLEYVSVRPNWKVTQAVEEIKKLSSGYRSIVFIYVTEEDGQFLGVVSLRRLFIADSETKMGDIIKSLSLVSTLRPNDKIQKVIQVMTKYNLFTAAVVDKDNKLVGIVTIDDVMRQLFPNA